MSISDSYDPQFFEPLFQAEERHFWFVSRNQVVADTLQALDRNLKDGYRVLELGCGNGNTLRVTESACQRGKVMGSDLFHSGLVLARKRVNCPLVQADVLNLPFAGGFELVSFFDVLEHIQDDRKMLEKVREILAPGGYVVITVPADPGLWSYFDEASHHQRRYTRETLTRLLEDAGYEIIRLTAFMSLTYPLVWLRRKLTHRNTDTGVPLDADLLAYQELQVNGVMNWALTQLLKLERGWLQRGNTFKKGSSLLAVARRRIT